MTTDWKDEHAAAVSKVVLLGELGDRAAASASSMWNDGCDKITTYVVGMKNGEAVAFELHSITQGKPGVVSTPTDPSKAQPFADVEEQAEVVKRPNYLATEEDLRPPVIE